MNNDPEPERKISVAEQAGRLALGAAGAYAAGYLLALFFWRGLNAHGPALISTVAFVGLAAFILIAERRSRT